MTTTVDWNVLDKPGVRDVASRAARKVFDRYQDSILSDRDDLEQDALTYIASMERLREVTDELGLLNYRLEQVLTYNLRTEVRQRSKQLSYDKLTSEGGDDEGKTYIRPYVAFETSSKSYTRESVESLLPAVWDESYCYGLPQKDSAPDPDMPRGSANKAHGNNLSAYIADIKTGWEKTPLTLKERRALVLAFAAGWTQKDIAFNQGCSQQAISERIDRAIGKIVARLNGGYWHEVLGDPDPEPPIAAVAA